MSNQMSRLWSIHYIKTLYDPGDTLKCLSRSLGGYVDPQVFVIWSWNYF